VFLSFKAGGLRPPRGDGSAAASRRSSFVGSPGGGFRHRAGTNEEDGLVADGKVGINLKKKKMQ